MGTIVLGGVKMKYRIIEKKLNFLFHILNIDKSALAFQVQNLQHKLKLPGLISECENHVSELKLPNIFEIKIKRTKWKIYVHDEIMKANEKELRNEIQK